MRMALFMVLVLGSLLGVVKTAVASPPVILVLGDSLSAGYGLRAGEAWPILLQARIESVGYPHRVVNASISGETTAGGLARLPALLAAHLPQLVLVELGANDGLRGLPLEDMKANLQAILKAVTDAGASAVVLPMRVPPNYGPAYSNGFMATYTELPARFPRVSLAAFFLKDVALKPELLQADGLHPTADAQSLMLDAVWPAIATAIEQSNQVKK